MTYRELLELYKTGELELEQRKKVEKDIERQEAISDYLYEQEDIPELNDIFEENDNFTEDDVDKYVGTSLQKGIYQVMNELGLWCTI